MDLSELSELHRTIISKRADIDLLKKQMAELNSQLDEMEGKAIAALTEANMTSMKTQFGTIGIQNRFTVRCPDTYENWQKLWKYLDDLGHTEALKTINHQRLNGWYKEQLEAARIRGDVSWHPPGLAEPRVEEILFLRSK